MTICAFMARARISKGKMICLMTIIWKTAKMGCCKTSRHPQGLWERLVPFLAKQRTLARDAQWARATRAPDVLQQPFTGGFYSACALTRT
jgi:hypothetical protein